MSHIYNAKTTIFLPKSPNIFVVFEKLLGFRATTLKEEG